MHIMPVRHCPSESQRHVGAVRRYGTKPSAQARLHVLAKAVCWQGSVMAHGSAVVPLGGGSGHQLGPVGDEEKVEMRGIAETSSLFCGDF